MHVLRNNTKAAPEWRGELCHVYAWYPQQKWNYMAATSTRKPKIHISPCSVYWLRSNHVSQIKHLEFWDTLSICTLRKLENQVTLAQKKFTAVLGIDLYIHISDSKHSLPQRSRLRNISWVRSADITRYGIARVSSEHFLRELLAHAFVAAKIFLGGVHRLSHDNKSRLNRLPLLPTWLQAVLDGFKGGEGVRHGVFSLFYEEEIIAEPLENFAVASRLR